MMRASCWVGICVLLVQAAVLLALDGTAGDLSRSAKDMVHGYLDGNGKLSFLSPSPTMDVAIVRELFPHCIEAGKVLGVDEEFRSKLEAALTRLPPYRINRRGFLQEWIEDWTPGDQGNHARCDGQAGRRRSHLAQGSDCGSAGNWSPPVEQRQRDTSPREGLLGRSVDQRSALKRQILAVCELTRVASCQSAKAELG